MHAKYAVIPLLNGKREGHESHWGLAVLKIAIGIISLYDSLYMLETLRDNFLDINIFSESVNSEGKFTNREWPATWTLNDREKSTRQRNGEDYRIFTIQNVYCVREGLSCLDLSSDDASVNSYRTSLGLAIL